MRIRKHVFDHADSDILLYLRTPLASDGFRRGTLRLLRRGANQRGSFPLRREYCHGPACWAGV